jgi:hypothetical protein
MITKLTIENLRGIRTGTLEGIAPFTILTGPNASGKSTVLDALLIGASPNPEDAVGRAVQRHPESPNGARWLLGSGGNTAKLVIEDGGGKSWQRNLEYFDYCGKSLKAELLDRGAPSPFHMIQLNENEWADEAAQTYTGFSVDNQFVSERSTTRSLSTTEALRFIDPSLPIPLHDRFSDLRRQGELEAVHELLRPLVPDFKELILLSEASKPLLHIDRSQGSVPVALSGDGIQAFLQIVLESALPAGGLVLIEEPEVFLHPKALWQTARVLLGNLRRGVQTVLTTHSLELLDALLSEVTPEDLEKMALFNLRLDAGELRNTRWAGKEMAFARQEMESDLR